MDFADHVGAVERAVAAFAHALRGGPLDVRVPSCPAWTVADLAVHVGEFSGFWTHILCQGLQRAKTPFPDPPSGLDPGSLADWYERVGSDLVSVLRRTPPDTEVWTWHETDHAARFVARRCAHELAVHRFDAQLARAVPEPVDARLAADGIEEIFVILSAHEPSGLARGETLHLHGTDRGDEWLLSLRPDGVGVARDHVKADLALRGAVSDLELLLYQRPTIGAVERLGDSAVLDAWYREFVFT